MYEEILGSEVNKEEMLEELLKPLGINNLKMNYNEHGKPYLTHHPEIHFNFSHSGNVALCAIDSQPVGADVETSRKITPSLIAYTMNDMEQSQIASAPESLSAFLALWTKKEAVLKLTGEGINDNMKETLKNAKAEWFTTTERIDKNYLYTVCEQ